MQLTGGREEYAAISGAEIKGKGKGKPDLITRVNVNDLTSAGVSKMQRQVYGRDRMGKGKGRGK